MRRLAILCLCVAGSSFAQVRIPGPGGVGASGGGGTLPVFVGAAATDNGGVSSTSSGTTGTGINVPSGVVIYAFVVWTGICPGTPVTVTITRTGGGTFTQTPDGFYTDPDGALCSSQWYMTGAAANASDTYTATLGTAEQNVAMSVIVFSGPTALDAHPTTAANSGGTTATVVSNPITTTASLEVIINGMASAAFTGTWSADTADGYTIPTGATSPDIWSSIQYKIVSSIQTAVTVTATKSANTWIHNAVSTFK